MVLRFFPFIILSGIILFSACENNSSEKENTVISGAELYRKNCAVCHGNDGKKGLSGASNLSISKLEYPFIVDVITNGRKAMPPFKALLNSDETHMFYKHKHNINKISNMWVPSYH